MKSTTSYKIVWGAVLLFAASAAACGSSPQSLAGTTPSVLSSVASATDSGGTFSALKTGKGKGPDKGGDDTTYTYRTGKGVLILRDAAGRARRVRALLLSA